MTWPGMSWRFARAVHARNGSAAARSAKKLMGKGTAGLFKLLDGLERATAGGKK